MGHKAHPTGLRLGITEDWRSHWFADKKTFGTYLVEDQKIRTFIKHEYYFAGISYSDVERTRDRAQVTIHCARPGLIIGRRGVEVERLKGALEDLTGHAVEVGVEEIREPLLEAQLVAEDVAQQLQRRTAFRRAMRRAAEMTMTAGAEGVKVQMAGRLGGSEMARREKVIMGRLPLHRLRADIGYGFTEARTKYGHIGVKVWVNRGMHAPAQQTGQEEKRDALDA